jgi:hypothetical protein
MKAARHFLWAASLCLAAIFTAPAIGAPEPNPHSGFAQLQDCRALVGTAQSSDPRKPLFCAGELRALAYVSHVLPPDLNSCVPDGIPNGQLALVVIHYIEARPAQMQEDFMKLAIKAYRDAWPCER